MKLNVTVTGPETGLPPTRQQGAALGCWFSRRTRQYEVPGETCFYRVFSSGP